VKWNVKYYDHNTILKMIREKKINWGSWKERVEVGWHNFDVQPRIVFFHRNQSHKDVKDWKVRKEKNQEKWNKKKSSSKLELVMKILKKKY
jgi:hypothetical protein